MHPYIVPRALPRGCPDRGAISRLQSSVPGSPSWARRAWWAIQATTVIGLSDKYSAGFTEAKNGHRLLANLGHKANL